MCCGRWAWRAASTYKLALLLRHFVVRIKQPRAEKVYKTKEKAAGRRQEEAVRQVQAEKKRNCARKENPKAAEKEKAI